MHGFRDRDKIRCNPAEKRRLCLQLAAEKYLEDGVILMGAFYSDRRAE
jgi:hypothetical protein